LSWSVTPPIDSRSCTVWYTVLSEIVGISRRARSYNESTVGCDASPCSKRNIACRWGVMRRPWLRNNSERAATSFIL